MVNTSSEQPGVLSEYLALEVLPSPASDVPGNATMTSPDTPANNPEYLSDSDTTRLTRIDNGKGALCRGDVMSSAGAAAQI